MEVKTPIIVNVVLQNPNEFDSLPALSDIQLWCESSIQANARDKAFENSLSVLIRIVDSVESSSLNKEYREKEGPTNVLSFPNELPEFMFNIPEFEEQNSVLGDLVICEPLVRQEALEQDKSIIEHWAHLVVHGVLHLQGFDHIDDNEAEQMEALEIKILEQFGFSDPYNKIN